MYTWINDLSDQQLIRILHDDAHFIDYIDSPSTEVQLFLIQLSPSYLWDIKNPSIDAIITAIIGQINIDDSNINNFIENCMINHLT